PPTTMAPAGASRRASSSSADRAGSQATATCSGPRDSAPLLAGRDRVAGADAAYVCRGQTCDLPVTGAGELAAALGVTG
ncbi:hypothetical protein, partial [Mycobacterium sp. E1319]|uniref:hypothetical protein n=1 Tax=Mycobacterium sp. E1319 TaxID=1834124 RepID=UPI000A4F96E4